MTPHIVDDLELSRQATHSHEAVRAHLTAVVRLLSDNLGTGVVALLSGVTPETVSRWMKEDAASQSRQTSERRLREAYRVYSDLVTVDSSHTVRAWFMGANPLLGDESPAEALAEDRFKPVLAAARAFRDGA